MRLNLKKEMKEKHDLWKRSFEKEEEERKERFMLKD